MDRYADGAHAKTADRARAVSRLCMRWPLHCFLAVAGLALLLAFTNAGGLADAGLVARLCGDFPAFSSVRRRKHCHRWPGGAAPPLLGWVAVTGHVRPRPLLLVLIIAWTRPHFWALAIHRKEECRQGRCSRAAGYPASTTQGAYPALHLRPCWLVSLMPLRHHMSGLLYPRMCAGLGGRFLQ